MWEYIGRPRAGRQCEIRTEDGVFEAVYTDGWWRLLDGSYIEDKNVIEWREL